MQSGRALSFPATSVPAISELQTLCVRRGCSRSLAAAGSQHSQHKPTSRCQTARYSFIPTTTKHTRASARPGETTSNSLVLVAGHDVRGATQVSVGDAGHVQLKALLHDAYWYGGHFELVLLTGPPGRFSEWDLVLASPLHSGIYLTLAASR